LVAIHNSGDPNFKLGHKPEYNQGVPISLILGLLKKRGKRHLIGRRR
jgi:hypothetical protein